MKNKWAVARERENEGRVLDGYQVSFPAMKMLWNWTVVAVAQHCKGTKYH